MDKEDTSWAHFYSGENYDEISDKEILKWLCNEQKIKLENLPKKL